MRSLFYAPSLFLILGSSFASQADTPVPEVSALTPLVVRIQVTGENELKKRMSECLAAELRKDPGLKIGESRDAITLDVIIVRQKMTNGDVLGYLLYLGGYLPGPQNAERPDRTETEAVLIQWQTLRMAPPDLLVACNRAATDFQSEVVRPLRRTLKQFSDSLQRQGQP